MSIVGKRGRLGIYRMTPSQFQRACEADIFGDNRVELLAGIPFIMTQNPPHTFVVSTLGEILRPIARAAGHTVYEEKTVKLGSWRPMPDLAIVSGSFADYLRKLPSPAETSLFVEVSDTTYPKDRGLKYRRYAAAGIPAYWIVKLDDRLIEAYTDPSGRGRSALYRSCLIYNEGDRVPIFNSTFLVGDILPPPAP
jgi:Uma2 family endonuclease